MNYRRSPGVKEVKALQDLPAPAPQHLRFHHLKTFQVSVQKKNNTLLLLLRRLCVILFIYDYKVQSHYNVMIRSDKTRAGENDMIDIIKNE